METQHTPTSTVVSSYQQTETPGIIRKSNKETCERIVVFLDIMGFKDMVARKEESSIIEKLKDLTYYIDGLTAPRSVLFHLFSDSIILFSDEITDSTFCDMCNIANSVVEHSISLGLPIKGAMSKGQCTVSTGLKPFYFGQPIIDAYSLEENAVLYGVVLHNTVEEMALQALQDDAAFLFDYKTPLKGGSSNHYILNWFGSEMENNKNNLMNIRKSVSDSPRRYIDNTLDFIENTIKKQITGQKF